jgi:hypothetical protein
MSYFILPIQRIIKYGPILTGIMNNIEDKTSDEYESFRIGLETVNSITSQLNMMLKDNQESLYIEKLIPNSEEVMIDGISLSGGLLIIGMLEYNNERYLNGTITKLKEKYEVKYFK